MADRWQTDEHAHESNETIEAASDRRQMKRRELIAGAAAPVAGVLATRTAESVSAAYVQGDTSNTAGAMTTLTGTVSANPVLRLVNGFTGTLDSADGVQGYAASTNAGVYGKNVITNGVGVWGEAPSGNAVYGHSAAGYGVVGVSGSGYGVQGAPPAVPTTPWDPAAGGALPPGSSGPRRRRPPTRCRGSRTAPALYAAVFQGKVSISGGRTDVSVAGDHSLLGYGNGSGLAGVVGYGNAAVAYGTWGQQAGGPLRGLLPRQSARQWRFRGDRLEERGLEASGRDIPARLLRRGARVVAGGLRLGDAEWRQGVHRPRPGLRLPD